MYRGFNLEIKGKANENYLEIGKKIFESQKKNIKLNFEKYFITNDVLSAKLIMEDWFPLIKSHIFLSHSHNDFNLALTIAGLLKDKLGIDTFIDSTIWGNSNELLRIIDDKYCYNPISSTYIYESRNYSTAHVHLMLMSALNNMINKSECLFFLNTPKSTSIKDEINNTTYSPWIFSELNTAKLINKITPDRLLIHTKKYSDTLTKAENLNESANKKFEVEYELELSHLETISQDVFTEWLEQNYTMNPEKALDDLYRKFPINKKFIK
ncbi:hypothetical protein [Elizabethkingia anophelis]|uniref:hypothetical protein n=1 Tax=Elizabethkingia anophelis TaxID=1117645 RepID=UPI000B35C64A|nr:hypothetical protein [Elizabethkingia anophelis]